MGKPEAKVEKYFHEKCKEKGYGCYKYTPTSIRGFPDRIFVGNGYTIFVEMKAPVGKLSPQQIKRIKEIEKNGGCVRVCYTREACDELLNEVIHRKYKKRISCFDAESQNLKGS